VYSELTRYYSNTGVDLDSKIRLNEQALAIFVQAGDRKKEADVLKDQGDLHQLQEDYRQALRELHRALTLYRSVQYPDVQGVYDLLGFVSTKTGDYKSGLTYGLEALKTARQRGDTSLYLCTIYNRLGLPTTRWDSSARRKNILKSRSPWPASTTTFPLSCTCRATLVPSF
jgi:tetratricopeptide (TPR) repeat protein